MIDPLTEKQYADCRELMELWRRFHDYFKLAVVGKEITPEKEHEFITIKSRIAMLHDSFMDCLEHDQNIGQNILGIVSRSITLKHIHRMSTAEIKKIELEWHESYLLLNETLGVLEDKRKRFAEIKPSQYYRQIYTERAYKAIKNFVTGWTFRALVAVVVVMVAIFAFVEMGGVDWAMQFPATRRIIVRLEDIVRVLAKDYPYRELSVFQRMDKLPPQFLNIRSVNAQTEPKYSKDAGIGRVAQAMAGSINDISGELRNAVEVRTEVYDPDIMYAAASGECVVWLFRMPSSQNAKLIETRYKAWLAERPAGVAPDWLLFRKANVIGVVFGGDARMRTWARDQFLHVRRKR